jgi:PAS domain S-box-containing protein
MNDDEKTREQLVHELTELRSQNAALKKSITGNLSTLPAVEEARRYAESIVETVREPLLVLDADLKIISANRYFYTTFNVTLGETLGCFIYDLGNKQWDIPKLRELLEEVLPEKQAFDDFEVIHDFQDIGHKIMLLNAREIYRKDIGTKMILLAIEDITERKEIEAGLEKTRKELAVIKIAADEVSEYAESVINTVREPLIALDQDLRVVTVSRSFYDFFKVSHEDTVGQLIYDLGNKQWDIPKLRELLETILPEKATFDNYEVEHDFATIGRRTMLLNARQIQRVLGKERIILLAIEDISEQKKLENLLKESEELYRGVFKTASDGILLLEKREGKITHTNPAAEKMLGYSTKDCIGNKLQDIGFMLDMVDFQTIMQDLNKNGIINYTDVTVTTKSGQHVDTDVYLVDKTRAVQCNIRDITDRKRAEEALHESEVLYRTLFDDAKDGIALADAETGRLVNCNQSLCQMVERDKTELEGQAQSILHPRAKVIERFSQTFKQHLTGDPGLTLEERLLAKSGKLIPVEIRAASIRINDRGFLMGIFRDITERKKAEEQLLQTLDSLRKAVGTTVHVMASAVEARDPYTAGHQIRSANLARAIATVMGLPPEKIEGIRMAGSIHDIGKLSIPAEILSKPTKLLEIEFALIKEHARRGFEMLKDVESPWPLAEIVYQHHERMDGSGYPRNLKGDDILIEARILAVADVVEAMASHRPYRPGLGIDTALNEIEKNRGIFYDNTVADACLRLFREKGFKLEGT